jgi:hypothetical protein
MRSNDSTQIAALNFCVDDLESLCAHDFCCGWKHLGRVLDRFYDLHNCTHRGYNYIHVARTSSEGLIATLLCRSASLKDTILIILTFLLVENFVITCLKSISIFLSVCHDVYYYYLFDSIH